MKNKNTENATPGWVNVQPDPYVVQRILEVLAAQHGVAVDGAVRESLNGTKTSDARKEELALAAGSAAYSAYWKALKVIVAELTADIDTSDVEAIAKKEGSK
jgi:plasmid stability protein